MLKRRAKEGLELLVGEVLKLCNQKPFGRYTALFSERGRSF